MSEEEVAQYISNLANTVPVPDEKHNVHKFLHSVATADDTTKVGNLKEEEIGIPRLPLRAYKSMALIADKIMGNDYFKEYFLDEGEILSSTSLSKEGFLLRLAVVQKKEIADVTKPRKINKSWFKKKPSSEEQL